MQISLSFITWLFFFSRKLQFLLLNGNKTCRPIRSVIILMINEPDFVITRMILQTELDSTQSYITITNRDAFGSSAISKSSVEFLRNFELG